MSLRACPLFLRSTAALIFPALLAACGGNVVVTGGGEGGDGGSGGSTGSTITDPDDCPAGFTLCGTQCVNTSVDAENCGECFSSCQGGQCQAGQCVTAPGCPPGLTDCGGACVDTSGDPFHCGGCFQECSPNTGCVGGDCVSVGCLCGDICTYTDLGSQVPQSATVGVNNLGDSYTLECSPGAGWPDVSYLFTAPYTAVFTFDTFGSVDTTLQIMDLGCGVYVCDDDSTPQGTSSASVELGAGQVVIVVVDAIASSGTVTLNVYEGKDCASCSEYVSGENQNLELCDKSYPLYEDLVFCLCEGACGMACQGVCNGNDFTPECEQCLSDPDEGCGNQVDACLNDF